MGTAGVVRMGQAAIPEPSRHRGAVQRLQAFPANRCLISKSNMTHWHKILNLDYSQRQGRAEWFRERQGRHARQTL